MKINKNFQEIVLNKKQFDLEEYVLSITEVDKPINLNIRLITKYKNSKYITLSEKIVIEKDKDIYPLSLFKRIFLSHHVYGEPIEHELLFRTNVKKYYYKNLVKYEVI